MPNSAQTKDRQPYTSGEENKNEAKENLKVVQGRTAEKKAPVMDDKQCHAEFQKALEKVPEDRIPEFLELIEEFSKQALPLPTEGDGSYKTVPEGKHMDKDELIDFLTNKEKGNWGRYLAAYNQNLAIDAITRPQLREYDISLMKRLETRFTPEKLDTIIQSDSKRIALEVKIASPEEIKKAMRIMHHISRHGLETAEVA